MKIIINGKIREHGVIDNLISEVIDNMARRIGVPEDTKIAIDGLEFKVLFTIDGEETYASVPREINGETVNEMFTVSVHLDEEGNILQEEDNEGESFYDGYSLAKSIGQEYNYEGIESKYQDSELEFKESLGEDTEGAKAITYIVIDNPETEIVRHFKDDLLVFEYEYKTKE